MGATGNDNVVVGTLTFKNQTIERKYDADVIWEKIESGLTIRNKDTIRSGDFSDAVLTLIDKTKININENSMIYVDVNENNVNLDFAYGSMSLSKKSDGSTVSDLNLKIKSGDNIVEIKDKDSDISLAKKGKEELSFQVNKGTAKLFNGDKEKEIKENETATLNGSEISVSEINLNLQSPADASFIAEKSETIPVNFSWTSRNANNLQLELAYDSRFQRIYKIYNVDNDSYTTSLAPGNYYWRISSEKEKTKKKSEREYSQFRRLSVYSVFPPSLLTPEKNQVFSFANTPPIVHFSWKRSEIVRNYKLEISKNSSFTEIVKSTFSSQSFANVDNLEAGKYFARIITEPAREEFKPETSEAISFVIERKSQLDAPNLISPNGQELSVTLFAKSGFLFQVKDSPELTNYQFQISSDPNFTKIITEESSTTNQVKIVRKLEVGTYYWRALGKTNDGRQTPYSETGKFSIRENQVVELLTPKNNSEIDIKENPIFFQWKRLPYKSKFILEISTAEDFSKNLQSIKTEEYSASVKLPKEATYFWRITSLGEDDSVYSKSAAFSFQLEEVKELTPIYPLKNARVDMAHQNSLQFKWENNPKVENYLFELYRTKAGAKTLIAKSKTKNNSFVFKDLSKLDEGAFLWTLEESDENEAETGKKVSIPFTIYLSEKPGTPTIKTPKKMYVE